MQKEEQKQQNKKNKLNSYIKYSSISFQMLVIILVFAFIGNKLDVYANFEKPFITAILSIIGLSLALYVGIKKITK